MISARQASLGWLLAAGIVAVAATGVASGAAASPTPNTSQPLTVSKSFPAYGAVMAGMSCASTKDCEAVGSTNWVDNPFLGSTAVILGTTNGGHTWKAQVPPVGVTGLSGVSCASTNDCQAFGFGQLGSEVIGTTNGGATWTEEASLEYLDPVSGLSCPSAQNCVAVGSGVGLALDYVTADGGATWKTYNLPSAVGALHGVACSSTTTCTAVGVRGTYPNTKSAILRSTNGGKAWKLQKTPSHVLSLNGVDCSSSSTCTAVGERGSYTSPSAAIFGTHGAKWRVELTSKRLSNLTSVSCASVKVCEAGGSGGIKAITVGTKNAGSSWTAQKTPNAIGVIAFPCLLGGGCQGLSCPSVHKCEGAAEGILIGTTSTKAAWKSQPIPTGFNDPTAVSCGSAKVCEVFGASVHNAALALGTTNGGQTWSAQHLTGHLRSIAAASCATASVCEAVGQQIPYPLAVGTTNGGAKWKVQHLPGGAGLMRGISCPSVKVCVAVGQRSTAADSSVAVTTHNGGKSWRLQALPAKVSAAMAVACASKSDCVVTGTAGGIPGLSSHGAAVTTTDGGRKWQVHVIKRGVTEVQQVSCPSTKVCVATGASNVLRTTNGGKSWSIDSSVSGNDLFGGVSCASPSTCDVVGYGLTASVGPGSSIRHVMAGADLRSTDGGTKWTTAPVPAVVGVISGIDCAAASHCLAIGVGQSGGIGTLVLAR